MFCKSERLDLDTSVISKRHNHLWKWELSFCCDFILYFF
jgi:hypothetical protein